MQSAVKMTGLQVFVQRKLAPAVQGDADQIVDFVGPRREIHRVESDAGESDRNLQGDGAELEGGLDQEVGDTSETGDWGGIALAFGGHQGESFFVKHFFGMHLARQELVAVPSRRDKCGGLFGVASQIFPSV